MFIIDAIAYAIISIPILCGLALCFLMALAMVIFPILTFIEEAKESPRTAWLGLFCFLCIVSAFYLDARNRGLL